ncbi:MAG: hypothetical protein ACOC1P_05295 [Minisyncoccales bacterium]
MVWKGVLLEESLKDKKIFDLVKILKTDIERLEKENRTMTFHDIEIEDKNKNKFVETTKNLIKKGFYTHICKNGEM